MTRSSAFYPSTMWSIGKWISSSPHPIGATKHYGFCCTDAGLFCSPAPNLRLHRRRRPLQNALVALSPCHPYRGKGTGLFPFQVTNNGCCGRILSDLIFGWVFLKPGAICRLPFRPELFFELRTTDFNLHWRGIMINFKVGTPNHMDQQPSDSLLSTLISTTAQTEPRG